MRKWLLPLVAVALAIATVTFWQSWRQERARADRLQAALDAPGPGPQASMAVTPTAGPLPQAGGAEPAAADAAAAGDEGFTGEETLFLQDPAYRAAYRKYRLAELTRGHVDITRILGISRETADRLLAYLVDREIDWLSVARRNPQTAEEREARELENEGRQREEDAGIGAIIGDARVASWHGYQESLGQRHEVLAVGRSLALAGAPLSVDQVDALVAVMAAERRRVRDEIARFSAGLGPEDGREAKVQGYRDARHAELERAGEDRVRAEAARILTTEQLAAFVELRRQWQAGTDAEVEFFRATDEARRRLRERQ